MFKKVLIAEDVDAVNTALPGFLLKMGVKEVVYSQYCDEAYVKSKKAALENTPYDLLICDLSFRQDHRTEKIASGEELAFIIKREMPTVKVIIHSIEDQPARVKKIMAYVDAYVCKGRNGMNYLKQAVETVYEGKTYLSPDIQQTLQNKNITELSVYDLSLLKHLAQGCTQEEISNHFRTKGMAPFSKSSIEKKLKDLREEFGARTNPQLINIVLSLHLI
ncbi:DNA-binding response regulator [Salinimicrobium sp. GXAS 041]|uniref:DNA-binding response regulator n=1 Tax=Salinimicrobium sp. GXAS 041 TaxID=3400806 RepID=UPI003C76F0F7